MITDGGAWVAVVGEYVNRTELSLSTSVEWALELDPVSDVEMDESSLAALCVTTVTEVIVTQSSGSYEVSLSPPVSTCPVLCEGGGLLLVECAVVFRVTDELWSYEDPSAEDNDRLEVCTVLTISDVEEVRSMIAVVVAVSSELVLVSEGEATGDWDRPDAAVSVNL